MTEFIDTKTWSSVMPGKGLESPVVAMRLVLMDALLVTGSMESRRGQVLQELVAAAGLTASKEWNDTARKAATRLREIGLIESDSSQGCGTRRVSLLRRPDGEQIAALTALMPEARRVLAAADVPIAAAVAGLPERRPTRRQRPQIGNAQFMKARADAAAARSRPRLRGRFKPEDAVPEGASQVNPRIAEILARYQ